MVVKTMLNKKSYKDKPHSTCLYCENRGTFCCGSRTSDMTLERWREYMRDMKEVEGLTYADISQRTQELGVPIPAKTIEKKLAPGGDGQDIMRETARAIEIAILGAAPYPCYRIFLAANPAVAAVPSELEHEIERLHHEIEQIHASYHEELETVRAEAKQKVEYLRAECEKKDKLIDRLLR